MFGWILLFPVNVSIELRVFILPELHLCFEREYLTRGMFSEEICSVIWAEDRDWTDFVFLFLLIAIFVTIADF